MRLSYVVVIGNVLYIGCLATFEKKLISAIGSIDDLDADY